jgi:hypothetical protein
MRSFLIATAALCAAFSLSGCDAADRAALTGAKPPASIATSAPAGAPQPTPLDAALLFPPAKAADAPRLIRVSAAPRPVVQTRHQRKAHGVARRTYARVHIRDYVEQSVTRGAYGDPADDRQIRQRIEASDRWDERRSSFSEGYDLADVRDARAPTAAGRDRDGLLTWPGKISDRR